MSTGNSRSDEERGWLGFEALQQALEGLLDDRGFNPDEGRRISGILPGAVERCYNRTVLRGGYRVVEHWDVAKGTRKWTHRPGRFSSRKRDTIGDSWQ